jgi:hypothetical protein
VPVASNAAGLRVKCGSVRLERPEAAAEADKIQQHGGRRTCWGDDCQPTLAASKAILKLDERAEPTGVDEAHLTEIDENVGSALASRLPQRGTKVAATGDVELAFGSDHSWFSSRQWPEGRWGKGTRLSRLCTLKPIRERGVETRRGPAPSQTARVQPGVTWPRAAGQPGSSRSTPRAVRGGRLGVLASSSPGAAEFSVWRDGRCRGDPHETGQGSAQCMIDASKGGAPSDLRIRSRGRPDGRPAR